MSFVMIAAGRSSSARVRTLSLTTLLCAAAVAAGALLAAGSGLGYWLAQPDAAALQQAAPPLLPTGVQQFAVEQLGALSGRLFKLESQASRLIERLGTAPAGLPANGAAPVTGATKSARGGPLLPPRQDALAQDPLAQDPLAHQPVAHEAVLALEARLADLDLQLSSAADAAALQNMALMRLPTRSPIEGAEMVSNFGNRDDPLTGRRAFHGGIDLKAGPGTAIQAAAGGVVTWSGFKSDFGRVVEIDHGNGLATRYAHASQLFVKVGDVVTPGERIAAVGTSGRSTGPHLHYEVLRHGEATDPQRYLRAQPQGARH